MPDVWLPGVFRDPGINAGYNSGRSRMEQTVAHYTVGADSRSVGQRGYFHFLVHRDSTRENGCTQYAEIDAVTWHGFKAGHYDANSAGPGIEFERRVTGGLNAEGLSEAEPLTQNQIVWGGRIVAFLAKWGIPASLYDGPRYPGSVVGWINHQALDSDRSDGLLRSEWDQITGDDDMGYASWSKADKDALIWDVSVAFLTTLDNHGTAVGLTTWGDTVREQLSVAQKTINGVARIESKLDEG